MMFFQDTRSIGLIFWIVAIMFVATAVMALMGAFTEGTVGIPDYVTDTKMYCLLIGVGSAIVGVIYAVIAHKVMSKNMKPIQVLRSYVLTVGLCTLIAGVLGGLAESQYTDHTDIGTTAMIVSIVISIIVLLMGAVIANGKKGVLKKVIWVILVISFIVMAINSLLPADTYWDYADKIAHLLIAVFMLIFIADGEVIREMGAKS